MNPTKYVIKKEKSEDFLKRTGLGNTYVFTDRRNATKFQSKRAASLFLVSVLEPGLTVTL
jgi:hypothetical protein